MRTLISALLLLATLTACGGGDDTKPESSDTPKSEPKGRTVSGSVLLDTDHVEWGTQKLCTGAGDYEDVAEGSTVMVEVNGEMVAEGELEAGSKFDSPSLRGVNAQCEFTFRIEDVPDAEVYQVVVEGHEVEPTKVKAANAYGALVFIGG